MINLVLFPLEINLAPFPVSFDQPNSTQKWRLTFHRVNSSDTGFYQCQVCSSLVPVPVLGPVPVPVPVLVIGLVLAPVPVLEPVIGPGSCIFPSPQTA